MIYVIVTDFLVATPGCFQMRINVALFYSESVDVSGLNRSILFWTLSCLPVYVFIKYSTF